MRTIVILIVMSSVSSLLSQGQSIPIAESPSQHGPITCFARTTTGVFLPIRRNDRIFGIPSNTFLCDQAGMTGSCPWAAKHARFGNRSETTTGANSHS